MFLFDTEHTGLSTATAACAGGTNYKWSKTVDNASMYTSAAIAADNSIYLADYDLYAFNPTSAGSAKWVFTFPTGYYDDYSSPAIGADGTIYVGATDGNLYAITPAGTENWAYLTTPGEAVESSPAIGADGTIYVGSDDGNLYAINSNGSEKWAFPTGGWVRSSPAIGPDGTIYVASDDGNLYALTDGGPGTVTLKWTKSSAGAEFYSSPTFGNANGGTIYFSSYWNNVVYAINASTGFENWEFAFPGDSASYSSPAIGPDGTIYVGSYGGNLYALTDGGGSATEKWAFPTGGDVNSSPAIGADGTIYVGSNNTTVGPGYGQVYAITDNVTSASEKWPPLAIGTPVNASLAIGANGTIYFGSGYTLYGQPSPSTAISAPASFALGSSPVGDTLTKNFKLKNTGKAALFITGVTSNDAPEFAETATTCPSGGLAPGGICTIAIGFTPSALTSPSATLTLIDNATTCPQTVNVSGTGTIDMTVTPTNYTFGSVKVGSTKTKPITVHNLQTKAVSLTLPPTFTGPNAGDFSVTGSSCPAPLGPKARCSLYVTFAPTAAVGPEGESATMTVTDSPDPLGPYTVVFSTAQTIPATVKPTSLAYGTLTVRKPSSTKNVTVTNLSSTALSVSESVAGTNAGDFIATAGSCGTSVSPNSSCTIPVTFTPTAGGSLETATMTLTVGNDPNSPYSIGLSGTGPP